jgi:uncharacterized protein DUF3558
VHQARVHRRGVSPSTGWWTSNWEGATATVRQMSRRWNARALAVVSSILVIAGCGGDDHRGASSNTSEAGITERVSDTTTIAVTGGGPVAPTDDACALLTAADVTEALGTEVDAGEPAGDARRRVCTFQTVAGVGVTVGVEGGSRFEAKAEASRNALDVEGVAVDALGDDALFFFSASDIPEGIGGVLVTKGETTVEVTLQGLDEDELRSASIAIASVAVGNL